MTTSMARRLMEKTEAQAAAAAPTPLWRPTGERIARAPITRFRQWLARHRGLEFDD